MKVLTKRFCVVFFALLLSCASVEAQIRPVQGDTGLQSAGATSIPIGTRGVTVAILLDIKALTLPDADDEVDFYIQTIYDGVTWTDVENIHFTDADDGTTAQRVIVIDGTKDGPGTLKSITGTDPAAGSEILEVVPANAIWRLVSAYLVLVTDANAANRFASLKLTDSSNMLYYSQATTAITASLTSRMTAAPALEFNTAGGTSKYTFGFPDFGLPSGYTFETNVVAIQVGDNWAAPQLNVEEWHDPAISTDGSIGDNLKSYDRPLGSQIRIKVLITGSSAPSWRYSAAAVFR